MVNGQTLLAGALHSRSGPRGHRPTKDGCNPAIISAMTSDLDIWRSAQLLVKRHGKDAPIHAAMRADAVLDKGDLDGYRTL